MHFHTNANIEYYRIIHVYKIKQKKIKNIGCIKVV